MRRCAGSVAGAFLLAIASPVLGQDECAQATPVGNGTFIADLGDNTGPTGDDSFCADADTIDEWYSFTPSQSGFLIVSTCNPGTQFDTSLIAYFDCAGDHAVCNDDAIGAPAECALGPADLNRKSTLDFFVLEGLTYYIRVSVVNDDFAAQGGSGTQYEITFDGPPPIIPACPCDWNGDTFLNNTDFFDWVNDFFSQSGPQGQSDFNEDGFENNQDWFDFINCFFTPPGAC